MSFCKYIYFQNNFKTFYLNFTFWHVFFNKKGWTHKIHPSSLLIDYKHNSISFS